MRLHIVLGTQNGDAINGPAYVQAIRDVEDLGFAGLWFFDAIGRGHLMPDALGAASAAGALTSMIEIGTCIVQAPLRHPVDLAHRVLTTHMLSGGRFRLGLGAGSTPGDFAAMERDFDGRFKALRRALDVMPRLWNGENVDGVDLTPWAAAKGGPPILIGSWAGSRWIPIAAERHAGWIGSAMYTNIGTLGEGVKRYRSFGGARAIVTNVQVDLTQPSTTLGPEDKLDLRCGPEEASARLEVLADAGFDDAILVVADHSRRNLEAVRALYAD